MSNELPEKPDFLRKIKDAEWEKGLPPRMAGKEVCEKIWNEYVVPAHTTKWISVKDRLPENNEEILVYSTTLEVEKVRKLKPYACYYHDGFRSYGDKMSQEWLSTITITHWMPLPEPPKLSSPETSAP